MVIAMKTMEQVTRIHGWAIFSLVCVAAAVFGLSLQLEPEPRALLMKENGIVETLSAVGYLVCIAVMLWRGGKEYIQEYWYVAVIFASFAAREMDFDKRFTNFGVLKSKFFVHPDVSWWGKVIAAIILLFIFSALFQIVKRHGRRFIQDVLSFNWSPMIWSIGFAGGFLVVSKFLDGLARKLSGWGVAEISAQADRMAGLAEESMELVVPYLFIVAILNQIAKKRLTEAA